MIKRKLLNRGIGVGMALMFASLPLLSGCTPYIGAKEHQILADAQKAAESAEAALNACRQKRADLERDLAQKKMKQAELQNVRDTVQKALNQ